jgi:hypothetical protein
MNTNVMENVIRDYNEYNGLAFKNRYCHLPEPKTHNISETSPSRE